jgi:hypothetical protein
MWGKQSTFENLEINLRTADPEDGCEEYNFNHPKHDVAYLVTGLKSCPLSNLIHNAQAHGAKALFIVNNKDDDIERIVVPDHMPGVQIHVFVISHTTGQTLIDVTKQASSEDQNWHMKSKIEIDFLAYASRKKVVSLEMTFSPEMSSATKFLSDLYESSFAQDLDNDLELSLHYPVMHCDKCKENGYKTPKRDCLSGGRYCWKANSDSEHGGEIILVQALKNMCTETTLSVKDRRKELGDYYWMYHQNCMEQFTPECPNAILSKLGIKEDVFNCITSSFYSDISRSQDTIVRKHPNIYLQDNYLLRLEKSNFNKIQHYAHFPLVSINDVVYYGPITFRSILGFICRHINDGLKGCSEFITEDDVKIQRNKGLFEASFIGLVVLFVLVAIYICKKKLRRKFDSELAYKIDQSVTEYLQKSGGTEL